MKAKHVILYLLLAIVSFSCIGEEALNAEADILSCALPGVAMTTSPIINNNSITIFVGPGTDISELTPEFTLTPGATINPLSGTERNFNTPQEYTVTAADGVWKKTYIISVIDTELATNYNFEDTLGGKKYYIFVEREGGKVVMEWASGNAGYAMTGVAKTADDYPTFQITDGKAGKCLSLVTRSTGFFGQIAGMPIAAGNLFIGSFDVSNAMSNPLKATKFGLPFRHVPTYLAGYYKRRALQIRLLYNLKPRLRLLGTGNSYALAATRLYDDHLYSRHTKYTGRYFRGGKGRRRRSLYRAYKNNDTVRYALCNNMPVFNHNKLV